MTGDSGAASTLTVVILTPVFFLLVAFAVYAGQISTARQDVVAAARDAARAAAVRQHPGSAQADGHAAAATTIDGSSTNCNGLSVVVDTGNLLPGGIVTATVTCTVTGSDVFAFWTPPGRTVTATSSAVVDRYRGGSP